MYSFTIRLNVLILSHRFISAGKALYIFILL